MEELILKMLDSNNDIRKQSQQYFENQLPTHLHQFVANILHSINSPSENISLLASILLKNKILDKAYYEQLSKDELNDIVSHIKSSVNLQKKLVVLKKQTQILVTILTKTNKKDEIFQYFKILSNVEMKSAQLLALYTIEISCQYSFNQKLLVEYSHQFELIFNKTLNSNDIEIKNAAFKTLITFLASITNPQTLTKFNKVLAQLFKKCVQIIQQNQQYGKDSIDSLCTLIQIHPNFIKPIINELLVIFTQIAQNNLKNFNINIRMTALQGIQSLISNHPNLLKKSQYFATKTLIVHIKLIAQDPFQSDEQWNKDLINEFCQKNDISSVASQNLTAICLVLKPKFLLPLLITPIRQCINNPLENYQHAGLVSMGILSEGASQNFRGELDQIFLMLSVVANSNNPKIIYDLIHVFALFSEQFMPDIQIKYGNQIISSILFALRSNYNKLKLIGLQCISNFCKGLSQHNKAVQVLWSSLDNLLNQISKIFEYSLVNEIFELKEEVINALASIAPQCKSKFMNYYNFFMPNLKGYIQKLKLNDPKDSLLLSRIIECMGYLLCSIQSEQNQLYFSECQIIMKNLIVIIKKLESDDIIFSSFFNFVETILIGLKSKFQIFLPTVFQYVQKAVNLEVECKIADTISQNQKNSKKIPINLKMYGGLKNFVFNTGALQVKIQGCQLFLAMAQHLGLLLQPYIPRCLQSVCQTLDFKISKGVRITIIQSIRYLVEDCKNIEQKKFFVKVVWKYLFGYLEKLLKQQKNMEQISEIFGCILHINKYLDPTILNNFYSLLFESLKILKQIEKQIKEEEGYEDEDEDQEEQNPELKSLEQALENIQQIIYKIGGNLRSLLKYFPQDYEFNQK